MNYTTHKQKLVISICLLNAEKDNIKNIISSYNKRLEIIYNSLISNMDELEKINNIENIKDEKDQINNLIVYSKIFNNTNNEIKNLKSDVTNNIKKIEDKNDFLETKIINKNSNDYTIIKNVCNNTLARIRQLIINKKIN